MNEKLWEYVILFFIFCIGMGLIRIWLNKVSSQIEKMVSNDQCLERKRVQCKKIDTLEKITKEQWGLINRHGHKGLDGDDNQVVRVGG